MFAPKYTISAQLLSNIKRITSLVNELNNRHFSHIVLVELERSAREISSYASTSIEGNPLPLTEVKKILKSRPEHIRDSEREVLNYNSALQKLNVKSAGKKTDISLSRILDIHRMVINGLLPKFETGHLRQKPVVVRDPVHGKTVFLPPDAQNVKQLMEELISFVHTQKTSTDPFIIAGIFHKQMVIIHPFTDGNGRTTRLATKLLLANMGLDTFNLFSFENYYNQNVTRYFQTVGESGDYYDIEGTIDFTAWLEYFTGGIIDEMLRVQKILPQVEMPAGVRLEVHHRKIFDFIQIHGSIADRDYKTLTNRARATRAIDFQTLISHGLIERMAKGKATYYVLKEKSG